MAHYAQTIVIGALWASIVGAPLAGLEFVEGHRFIARVTALDAL